jgi:hypothetical protein
MSAAPALLRLLTIIWFLLVLYRPAAAAQTVGSVTRVQNHAQIGAKTAVVGTPVQMNDALRTGANARLQITFRDGTLLTLGENARVVIDRYVFNPDQSTGAMALTTTTGALRFATGRLNQMRNKDITVFTPYAALAVRGTEFWMGPIDGHHGALLLKGKVRVGNQAGAVTLSEPGQGTDNVDADGNNKYQRWALGSLVWLAPVWFLGRTQPLVCGHLVLRDPDYTFV